MKNRIQFARYTWVFAVPLFVLVWFFPAHTAQAATKYVGNGTPQSCTEAALRNAVVGGGTIYFRCGPNPVNINVNSPIVFYSPTVLNGDDVNNNPDLITLNGQGRFRILYVEYQQRLDLSNITLRDGWGYSDVPSKPDGGSAIRIDGLATVNMYHVKFINNKFSAVNHGNEDESAYGGAIFSHDRVILNIRESYFDGNISYRGGGAVHTIETNLTVQYSTFKNNISTGRGSGAAIYNDNVYDTNGFVLVEDSYFENNTSTGEGGAILTQLFKGNQKGTYRRNTYIRNSVTRDPDGLANGGAIRVGDGTFEISDSFFQENTTEGQGGAIWVGETSRVKIYNNVIYANKAYKSTDPYPCTNDSRTSSYGGAIYIYGTPGDPGNSAEIANTLISSNFTHCYGGAIDYNSPGPLTIVNSTIVENSSNQNAGGISISQPSGGGNVTFKNTIVANNRVLVGPSNFNNCAKTSGNFINGGNNIQYSPLTDVPCASGFKIADPKVVWFADNGGRMLTRGLAPDSPAINAGNSNVCNAAPINNKDIRGFYRSPAAPCDIGAFETLNPIAFSANFNVPSIKVDKLVSLQYYIGNINANPVSNVAFSQTLPAGLKLATGVPIYNNCATPGTVSAPGGGTTITVSGVGVAAYQGCYIVVTVLGDIPGNYSTAPSALSTKETFPTAASSPATLFVQANPLQMSLDFTTATIVSGTNTNLQIVITNPNKISLPGIAFTQTLPSAIKVVSAPANACGGTVTAVAGTSQIKLANSTVSANQACNFLVQVTSQAPGSWTVTGALPYAPLSGTGSSVKNPKLDVVVPNLWAAPLSSNGVFMLGATAPNTTLNGKLTVRNTGHPLTNLTIAVNTPPGGPFSVTGLPLNLQGGTSGQINISCTPTTTGTFTGVLSLTTNDEGVAGTQINYQLVCAGGYVVTKNNDDGTDGTLSYALNNYAVNSGDAVVFQLTSGNTITFSNPLTLTVRPGVTVDGGCNGTPNVTLDGTGISGDGLKLTGGNFIGGLQIRNFGLRQLVSTGFNNTLRCVVLKKNG